MTHLIVPIIMAGGSGTRLWPVSRDTMPKQFIALFEGGLSTFQATLKRVSGPEFAAPVVITNDAFRFVVADQMMAAGVPGTIVLEPERRDSAVAVAVGAALTAAKKGPDTVCLVLAADHVIPETDLFVADCVEAAEAAREGWIMTLGIQPTTPATGYGYLAGGEPLGEGRRSCRLQSFVEKPDGATAERYVADGYLWNSGNFLFRADTMLNELAVHASAVLKAARGAIEGAVSDLDFLRLASLAFREAPKISIDYALMEKTGKAGVLPVQFTWSDVGAWDAIHDIKPRDGEGNVLEGAVSVMNTTNSLVRSEGPLTTVVGLDDVIVVSTLDAVLVAAKSEAPRVKDLVSKLTSEGHPQATDHLRIHRPWGWYQRIDIGARFQVKHICVYPGGILSLQRHHHRAEHWVVVHGTAEVTIDKEVKLFHENEAAYLPIGCVHRMRNPGKIDLKIIEVQVGSYTGEDDIVRIEDIYARV